jgi:phosphatidylcholine synthase
VWLGIALLVDGSTADRRRYRVVSACRNGTARHSICNRLYKLRLRPAIIVAQALQLPEGVGALTGIIIAVSGALYFADTRMKQPDNSFRGFPAVWNMVAFGLYAFLPPPAITVAVVVLLAAMTFLPINFVHPVRVVQWRAATLTILAVWFITCGWLIATDFQAPLWTKILLSATSAYLIGVAGVQQLMRRA